MIPVNCLPSEQDEGSETSFLSWELVMPFTLWKSNLFMPELDDDLRKWCSWVYLRNVVSYGGRGRLTSRDYLGMSVGMAYRTMEAHKSTTTSHKGAKILD